MWYKTAKQGSVWSRIGPDAEAQFDELLKQATKKNESSGKLYIDVNLLDQLFKKSNFKNLLIRFILSKYNMYYLGSFSESMFNDIEKLAAFEKFIPTFLANQIKINHKEYDDLSYQAQISLLKHEFAHAITSYTIDFRRGEDYLPHGELQKKDFAETPLMQLKNNLKSNWEKISPYVNEVDQNMGLLLNDNSMPSDENLQKINNAWNIFKLKVRNKEIKVPRQIIKIINKIDNFRITTLYSSPIDAFLDNFASKKDQQRRIKIYRQRAKTLVNDYDDLYLANPEETRAHIVEFQHLFSLSLLKQYYDHLLALNVYNEKNSKQQYLEYIKEMFNILMQTSNENFIFNSKYSWIYEYANFFGLLDTFYKFLSKSNDEKFKEQCAKHLNNVYQQLKEEFSVETGSFKSLNKSAIEENANDVNKKKGE